MSDKKQELAPDFADLHADPLASKYTIPGVGAYVSGVATIARFSGWVATALRHLPRSALVFGGARAWNAAGAAVADNLAGAGTRVFTRDFPGECSDLLIAEYGDLVSSNDIEVVVGTGGGKVLDTAKATAAASGRPVVTVPTIASNCAAWTPLSVIYKPDGGRGRTQFFDHAPVLTVVDYGVIACAPLGYLLRGIGDTVVKWYEARLSSGLVPSSAMVSAGLALAQVTRDELFAVSRGAVQAVHAGEPNPELASAVDTIIPVSGLVGGLGGEATRVAVAHSFYNAWTLVTPPPYAGHGLLVAYGLLVQLVLEKDWDELARLHKFYADIGLPLTLVDLGYHGDPEGQATAVASGMMQDEYLLRLDLGINQEGLVDAILAVGAAD